MDKKSPNNNVTNEPTPFSPGIVQNLRQMRFNFVELSGALGDLGTFLPLAAGMAYVAGMDLGAIFIFAGLGNIFAGVVFGLPVGIQPMKAIAAVAIADALLPPEIAAAGLILGAVMLVFGLTGLANLIERIIPLSVVRGIQLGVGLKLMLQAVEFVTDTPWVGFDSVTIAVAFAVFVLISHRWAGFPGALLLFAVGTVVAFVNTPGLLRGLTAGAPHLDIIIPAPRAWLNGLLYGAIPQLPLTLLNSVLAVCVLSGDLFPNRKIPAPRMSASVGVVNLVSCWFGAIPMCHGSGGMAAQYHFGARTGGSMVMLGIANLIIGLMFGAAAAAIIHAYPRSFLGVLLFFAGLELALPARRQTDRRGFTCIVVTAAGIIAINTLAGFALGIIAHLLSKHRSSNL